MTKTYKDLLISKQTYFTITHYNTSFKTHIQCNSNTCITECKFNNGRWLQEEHWKFIEGIFLYGNEWRKVEKYIKTRTAAQARSHAQKFFINIQKRFIDEHLSLFNCNVNVNVDDNVIGIMLIKFTIGNLNCNTVVRLFKEKNIEIGEYYKDEGKYKFLMAMQKLKNVYVNGMHKNKGNGCYSSSDKCNGNFLVLLKEKFVKLIMNLLQSTKVHNRQLAQLRFNLDNSDKVISCVCDSPFNWNNNCCCDSNSNTNSSSPKENVSETTTAVVKIDEYEHNTNNTNVNNKVNPFYLGNFQYNNNNNNNSPQIQSSSSPLNIPLNNTNIITSPHLNIINNNNNTNTDNSFLNSSFTSLDNFCSTSIFSF